ncbi:hypothetical protein K0M31_008388 [Melipona bicolor]|uniref:Uncharacterized protein n=1 Tax=Melipona bicolor TaxID=60889 RepID=A0AA40FRQ1_9HYME|nr:hypothetical protein K0M31_008388 [Melipona bicolor]
MAAYFENQRSSRVLAIHQVPRFRMDDALPGGCPRDSTTASHQVSPALPISVAFAPIVNPSLAFERRPCTSTRRPAAAQKLYDPPASGLSWKCPQAAGKDS